MNGEWSLAYPGIPLAAVAGVFGALLISVTAPVVICIAWWSGRLGRADDALPSLARLHDVVGLTPAAVTARARQLRPMLSRLPPEDIAPDATGLALGSLRRSRLLLGPADGPVLRASWEDGVLALMGPRSGKTTSLAVPMLLGAPGAALATSNRADLWATTHAARTDHGRVWVFDPQGITRGEQRWWWDPLTALTTVEDAARLAAHFVQPIRGSRTSDFWLAAAEDLLTSLFLAAARGGSLHDVQMWLADPSDEEPASLLLRQGWAQAGRALRGRQQGAIETRDGIWETARTAARCLQDPAIMAWVTPQKSSPLAQFHPAEFPFSTDTLYLLSKDGAGSCAPMVAGLTDQVLRWGVRAAEDYGGRLDPPLVAVLDEAANICPIADLPQLYSHYGGRGLSLITILQNYAQGSGVWGDRGMATLWAAGTIKLIGAGIDDPRFATDVSTLVGEHDVATLSLSRDPHGTMSRQLSTRRQRVLGPEHVRRLTRGTALLLAVGCRPALVRLLPWYEGPRAADLTAATAASVRAIAGFRAHGIRSAEPVALWPENTVDRAEPAAVVPALLRRFRRSGNPQA
ncbi:Type IV secretory pathway, VirD4 component, TraG/TraD family ATPase [Cryptosporangium aurantiacum]|uniref:Type IV secretory pathway, VirD4 component, TraG/TraD family ATPase n=1 Tax=Cryptosporangium aurantiacum TaxID=134849 RepID=A0A1M7PQM8_9ACTN|nr:Type IV secretory pathway, VirD4 component, TraG/TraD family ATPase [Cryptosporangium aurantiacum]